MPTIIRVVGILFAAVFCAFGARSSEVAASPLQLVGTADGREFRDFVVERGQILVRDGTKTSPLPIGIRWRLEGDLRAHADSFLLSPSYEIVTQAATPTVDQQRTRTYALIWLRRAWPWRDRQTADGIAVFVWLVDGNAVWASPMPVIARTASFNEYAAVKALELSGDMARGTPVVLMLRKESFIPADPWFDDEAANAALAAMHFGLVEDLPLLVAAVKSIDRRSGHEGTALLHMAAAGGFAGAVRLLLERGAKADLEARGYRTALHEAARNGRIDCVRALLSGGATRIRTDGDRQIPLDYALHHGHLELACSLLAEKSTTHIEGVLPLAIRQGNAATIEALLARIGNRQLRKFPEEVFGDGIATGNSVLTRTLLQAGVKADTVAGTFPLLVIAAASGSAESVEALLAAGAPVDRGDRDGVTALMAAAWAGDRLVVESLLRAGADNGRTDKDGRTALDHAMAAANDGIVELLRAQGASGGKTAAPINSGKTGVPRVVLNVGARAAPTFAAEDVDEPPEVRLAVTSYRPGYGGPREISTTTTTQTGFDQMGRPHVYEVRIPKVEGEFRRDSPTPWAVVSLIVEVDGRPSAVRIVDAIDANVARDAKTAVEQYEFTPGKREGQVVRTRLTLFVTP